LGPNKEGFFLNETKEAWRAPAAAGNYKLQIADSKFSISSILFRDSSMAAALPPN
jgi:hypothetical protein